MPMRLGEMLVASGVISPRELEAARAHQRVTGTRLGTTLIDLGLIEADEVARALARQHGVPAALSRHLRERDRSLTSYLPADLARELHALPVALSRGAEGVNLVVCFRDPDPDIIATVTRVVGFPVIPAVACERLLERELLHSYPPPAAPINTPPLGSALPSHGLPPRASGVVPAAAAVAVARTATPLPVAPAPTPTPRTTTPMAAVAAARASAPMAAVPAPVRVSTPMAAAPAEVASDRDDSESYDINVDDNDGDDPHGFGGLERLALVDLDDKRVSRDHSQALQLPALQGGGQSQRMAAATPSPSGRYPAVTADGVPRIAAPASTADGVPRIAPPAAATADAVPRVTAPIPAVTASGVPRVTAPTAAVTADGAPRVPPPPAAAPATGGGPRVAAPPPPTSAPPSMVTFNAPPAASAAPPPPTSQPGTAPGVGRVARTSVEGAALSTGPRDPVAERYLPHLIASWRVALVLAVEADRLTPRTGVGGALTAAMLEGAVIALAGAPILRGVIEARRPHVGEAVDRAGAPREAWLQALLASGGRELAIAPVIVGERVLRLVVAIGARLEVGAAAGEVIRVARTMVEAYHRAGDARSS